MLKLTGIQKSFDGLPVLSNLSLTLSQGEIVALIGPSGCGKTTLLNIISELTTPDAGTVEGAEGKLSYMFQNARLLPWRTVEENIRLVREDAPGEEVRTLIAAVGLEGFEHYYPGQLSGGMARRCALARAFHFGGSLFLMDEPFQGLDYGIRMEMVEMLLTMWRREKPGVLFVTHEISLWQPVLPCSPPDPPPFKPGTPSRGRRDGRHPHRNCWISAGRSFGKSRDSPGFRCTGRQTGVY